MKTRKYIIFAGLILMATACQGQTKKYTYSNYTHDHLDFSEVSIFLDKKTRDTIRIEGELKGQAVIEGIACKGSITLDSAGKLVKYNLAEDHNFSGNTFPKESFVRIGIDLKNSSDINSFKHYLAIRDARIRILNMCIFPEDQLINGIACAGGGETFFNTNWELVGCILAEADTVAGNVFPENTFVRFNKDSTISAFCPTDFEIQGYRCSGTDYNGMWMGGGGIFLHPNGRLKYFQPVDTVTIQGVLACHSSVRGGIFLHENGNLKACTSGKDQTVQGVFCGEKYRMKFDESGKLIYSEKEKIFD